MLKIFLPLAILDAPRGLVSRNLLAQAKEWAPDSFTDFLTDFSLVPSSQAMPLNVQP